jgi:hypothetical protein
MIWKAVIAVGCLTAMLACSATNGTSGKKSHSRDLITQEEIQEDAAPNAYELIRRLRPHWLRSRGAKSLKFAAESSHPVVYVNESHYGDIDSLSRIAIRNITAIKYLNSGEATTRFGLDHAGGAILITIF